MNEWRRGLGLGVVELVGEFFFFKSGLDVKVWVRTF